MSVIIKTMGGGGAAKEDTFAYITVTYPVGAVCSCTNGVKTLTAKNTSGLAVFEIPSAGDWTVNATLDGESAEETLTIDEQYSTSEVLLQLPPSFIKELKNMDVGGTVEIDGFTWVLVDKTVSSAIIALDHLISKIGYTSFSSAGYGASNVFTENKKFEEEYISDETKEYLVLKEYQGSTIKEKVYAYAFTPYIESFFVTGTSIKPIDDRYEYYKTEANLICEYEGAAAAYWIANVGSDGSGFSPVVTATGAKGQYMNKGQMKASVRPHMEVMLV